ncbi:MULTISPECIES: HNH endonuclease signature motif containing protein [unclassified Corallococcus]|uniref:HNH endonuclease signature motif containing protein n=1 Tax=unclassified Corallococcus TaxID=2685029 RepID=UPI001A90C680|nr:MULTISPECIES: HNH endonuclease signature motif containing protein [unclassified Corallococcus]MBN9687145.1 HNH endonuclease [Corallococcus sp. NCSPR001]WAS89028.1 HNH endonuclease signature motif containing protein [Corallococcus sp. NCRR]
MSCNRKHPLPKVGERFAKWTVTETALHVDEKPAVRVRCDCGTERVSLESNLRRSDTRGCFRCAHPARSAECRRCGEPFRPRSAAAEFCSRSCAANYRVSRRAPKPAPTPRAPRPSMADRFWAKVDRTNASGCWEWQGARLKSGGYGAFRIGDKTVRASRLAWELTHGPVPEGLIVRHLACDNPPCCNPAHLALGTMQDNVDDKDRKGRGRNQGGPWTRKNWKPTAVSS